MNQRYLRMGALLIFVVVLVGVHGPEVLLYALLALGAVLGPRQLIDLAIPTGIDGSRVFQFNLRSGMTAQEIITRAAQVIGTVNETIRNRYAGITYITDQLYGYYRQGEGGRSYTPKKSEQTQQDPVKSSNIGHMLPLDDYEDVLGWSELYLRDAPAIQLDGDIAQIADRWENRCDLEMWRRILTTTENPVGSAGYDVGWAIGTGMNVNFIPPQWGTNQFASSHTHFKFQAAATAAAWIALLNEMIADLRHHGHTGRLVCYTSESDIDTIVTMNAAGGRFIELLPQEVTATGGNTNAPVLTVRGETQGVPGEIYGYYRSNKGVVVELRSFGRIPQYYAWMTKSYGPNNPKNGLAIRIHPGVTQGFGLKVDPQLTRSLTPKLDMVKFDATHGVGINDRTNGVAGRVNNASFDNPSLS